VPSVLILYRAGEGSLPAHIGVPLTTAGFVTCSLPFSVTSDELCQAFPHGMPDVTVADMGNQVDLFVLRHHRQVMKDTWGETLPFPPLVALLSRSHFYEPDLRLLIDDFLLPPYDPEELKHRVNLLLFRRRFIEQGDTLVFAGIRLFLSLGRATTLTGESIDLTRREFDLLRFLMTHRGRGFTRTQLLSHVWGMDYEGGERTVDIHIRRLRTKLPSETVKCLDTRRGYGYGFRVDL
jgi:hypothetical protein